MTDDRLALAPLASAAATLRTVMEMAPRTMVVRDSIIKRFEFTYELSWRAMRRALEAHGTAVDAFSRRNLYREAARFGLIDDPETWFEYHAARNLASHTCNEDMAVRVVAMMEGFLPAVERLLAALAKFDVDPA